MSDLTDEPDENDTSYAETRDRQTKLEGLVEEHDGDFQEGVDAQRTGEMPDPDEEGNFGAT
ncbi:MAG: hypothetical protein JJE52_18515 [Acidimicrobiia bacterium]|nr:hypothetical protein [Acidimicrobiia bacterium]